MRKGVLLAIVCLVAAGFVVPGALSPGTAGQKATILAVQNPILDSGVNGTLGDNGWYVSAATVWIQKNGTAAGTVNYTLDNATWLPYTKPIVITFNGTTNVELRGYIDPSTSQTVKYTVKVDCVKPVTNATFTDPILKLVASDNVSGVAQTMFRVDGGAWTVFSTQYQPSVGTHFIEFNSTDVAGNKEATKNITVKASRDPIVKSGVNGTLGDNGWYISAAIVWLQLGKDCTVNYTLDNVTWLPYTKPIIVTKNGTTEVTLHGYVNETTNETQKFEVKIDCIKPLSVADFSDPVFKLITYDNQSGVKKVMFRVDGGTWWLYLNPYKPEVGTHRIEFYGIDQAGNTESVRNVTVQVTAHPNYTVAEIIIAAMAIGIVALLLLVRRKPTAHEAGDAPKDEKKE